jgi:hypothetical protein
MDVLRTAVEATKRKNISTIVVASTTGNTALKLLDLVKPEKLKVIVVTHDEGRPIQEKRFNEDIRMQLLANNITVYTHNSPWFLLRKTITKVLGKFDFLPWQRHLQEVKAKYGTGIKVCHIILQMLMEGKVLRDDRVVAIAGTKSGADSVGIFLADAKKKWPFLEEIIGGQMKPELMERSEHKFVG